MRLLIFLFQFRGPVFHIRELPRKRRHRVRLWQREQNPRTAPPKRVHREFWRVCELHWRNFDHQLDLDSDFSF